MDEERATPWESIVMAIIVLAFTGFFMIPLGVHWIKVIVEFWF